MTFGAQPGDVLRLIVVGGLAMVSAGVGVGLGISPLRSQSMSSLLYGMGSFDAPSFLATATFLILVAMAVRWIPVRRAIHVDPMVALCFA
jgi:ABC-type antimicrobial peptide transport system permease subunit